MYSIIVRNGMVHAGLGKAPEKIDIAIQGSEIVCMGNAIQGPAQTTIDAAGLVVAPGFIDLHSHTDWTHFSNPLAASKLLQGVTTEVTCNCGIGPFPVNPCREEEFQAFLNMHGFVLPAEGINWRSFDEYARSLDRIGLGVNIAPLVGHAALRIAVMGSENRAPSQEESDEMKILLAECLNQGAWGLSAGLVYPPSCFAQTDELVQLARVVAALDSLFACHIRSESRMLLESIAEIIKVGEESCARVQASHLKAIGKPNWGKGAQALEMIKGAINAGINIGTDQYPYEATATTLSVVVPMWAHDGGVSGLMDNLRNMELRERIEKEVHCEIEMRGGAERIVITGVRSKHNACLSGKNISEIACMWDCSPEQAVIRLLVEEAAAVSAIYNSISPDDMESILSSSSVAVASDGQALCIEKNAGKFAHPRSYGTFPRILGKYVRERKLLSMETAIYKMTGLPAERLKLSDRGVLRVGAAADIAIFDPARVGDAADFARPHQYPHGFEYVLVNGQIAVLNDKLTGIAAGRTLRRRSVPAKVLD